ncbi:MAG TPA: SDR family NAD(P)-dependent oxidoreductase [Gemmatimonadales bacterium]|nr:SDR family NAD(P)-dependent oxidoreductase [Gemmatimonadales bacterium]
MSLVGRTAVVTGGSQGLGAVVARLLAEAGVAVVVAARTEARLNAVAGDLRAAGHKAWGVRCDVTDPASVRALAEAAIGHLGRVDILVNNAGAAMSAPAQKTRLEDWNRMLAVNATSTFLCTQALLGGMLERGWGRVVNVASVAGISGDRYISAYSAAKHAVVGFTRSVAAETAGHGVTVNAVCPGYVDTQLTQETIERVAARTGKTHAEALQAVLRASQQPRLIAPEEVARVIVALCTEDGAALTGLAIGLDGGSFRP